MHHPEPTMRHEPTAPVETKLSMDAGQTGPGTTILQISAAAAALIGVPGLAMATTFTPPPGVSDYRLLFITADPITGSSTVIGTYNSFVTSEAAQDTSLPATTWTAIVSTPTVSAATNVSIGATGDANVPIYLVDGTTLAATSTTSFFAGNILAVPNKDQFGNTVSGTLYWSGYAWTGSKPDGSAETGNELGATGGTEIGTTWLGAGSVISLYNDTANGVITPPGDVYSLYALSGEIDVPEPATGSALLIGGLIVTRVFRRRCH
jgi:hypothetical protein